MSTKSSDHLFQLIHALSKSEKRYFRLFSSCLNSASDKKFLHLFDLIEKQKVYDERVLLQRSKHIKPLQLHNLKANLRNQILRSLKLFSMRNSTDMQLRDLNTYSQILFNKGLYEQSVRMIDKAKKIAAAHDRSVLLLDAIEQERNLLPHTISARNTERINKVIQETRTVTKSIDNINRFSNLNARLNSYYVRIGFIRNRNDHRSVKKFFFGSLPSYKEKELSFAERLYLYSAFTSYYFFVQDFRNGKKFARKYVGLFEKEPGRILQKPELYIKGLNQLLVAENKLFQFREFEETYKKLLRVHSIKGFHLTENIQVMLFKYKYMHKINQYFMMGDFTGGTKIMTVAENDLDRFAKRLDRHYVLLFYYKVACLYFGAENFKRALLWLNKIINSKDVDLREDILSFARILNLICHFELGNFELVSHHIRSTYRFLLKKEGLLKYHHYILDFMRNLDDDSYGKKLIREFSDLKKKLVPLEDHAYEKRPLLYFDIISWLESKISGRSVENIIREKFKTRTAQKKKR